VLGGPLESCSTDPLTGFYRDGRCHTGPGDFGSHTICAVVTAEFLEYQQSVGNDLSTPVPEHEFPGLSAGDRWCVTTPCACARSMSYRSTCSRSTRSTFPPIQARSAPDARSGPLQRRRQGSGPTVEARIEATAAPPSAPPIVRVTVFMPVAMPVSVGPTFSMIRLTIAANARPIPAPSRRAAG